MENGIYAMDHHSKYLENPINSDGQSAILIYRDV